MQVLCVQKGNEMIQIISGDVTNVNTSHAIVAHVCNDIGAWGAGVSGAIGKKWRSAEDLFRVWAQCGKAENLESLFPKYELGYVQFVPVDINMIYVANMVAQHKLISPKNPIPLKMEALSKCLFKLYTHAKTNQFSVHMPMIGAGLAGGDWNEILPLITNISDSYGVATTIYEFKGLS